MPLTYQNTTAVGTASPVMLDWTIVPFSVSYAVIPQGNTTASYDVQYTLDDPNNPALTPKWFAGGSTTGNSTGSFTFPIVAVRLETTAISAAGTVEFAVIQGLPIT